MYEIHFRVFRDFLGQCCFLGYFRNFRRRGHLVKTLYLSTLRTLEQNCNFVVRLKFAIEIINDFKATRKKLFRQILIYSKFLFFKYQCGKLAGKFLLVGFKQGFVHGENVLTNLIPMFPFFTIVSRLLQKQSSEGVLAKVTRKHVCRNLFLIKLHT